MSLQEQIRADMVTAMKAKEERTVSVLRGLMTMCMQELTATKRTPQDALSDDEVVSLIRRSVKQRKEAATQFRAGGREDLAVEEDAETVVLERYLPALLSEEEVEKTVHAKMTALSITDKSKQGQLIGAVLAELKGKTDGAVVKKIVERLLS